MESFIAHLLLYDELADFPASIKAPIFVKLVRTNQLTAEHLKILLSRDQKRLDLSGCPGTVLLFAS